VIAFDGAMDTGLARVSVFVSVILRKLDVEFLSWKKIPPCAVVKLLLAGSVTALNAEFVMYVYVFANAAKFALKSTLVPVSIRTGRRPYICPPTSSVAMVVCEFERKPLRGLVIPIPKFPLDVIVIRLMLAPLKWIFAPDGQLRNVLLSAEA
jgi:hypothetical protein